jgi:hypothetical protein
MVAGPGERLVHISEKNAAFRREVPSEVKWRERRRGKRMNSGVPVALEWQSDEGRIRAEAKTRIVGSYGCLVVVPHDLPLEHAVHLTNLLTQESAAAIVVWKGKARPEGFELGIELTDPGLDFWQLEL